MDTISAHTLSARSLSTLLAGWRGAGTAYGSLAERIRLLALDGRISPATRLPSERELAAKLGLSRTTVAAAYAQLKRDGYLLSQRGSGSVIRLPFAQPIRDEPQAGLLDFSRAVLPGVPEVAVAARAAAEKLSAHLGSPGFEPAGLQALRQALADRYTARRLPTEADQIMVTTGAQHAIALIARTILARGDRALIENPSYPNAFDTLTSAGARLVSVGVTSAQGWDGPGLEQAIQRTSPALAYLMPDHHNPTGASMSSELKERVLRLAERHGMAVIADETVAELGLDDTSEVPPFASFGPAMLVGSVSKTVWGGIRVGWIRADRGVIQRLVGARSTNDLGTPLLEQLLVLELMPALDEIIASRRATLRRGRATLGRLLAERLPEWTVPPVGGGLSAWVGLGHPVSSQLALAARTEGLIIAAGPRFGMDGAFERFLRVPFCFTDAQVEQGVDALARAWASVGRHPTLEAASQLAGSVV